jgi:hypothetical protein
VSHKGYEELYVPGTRAVDTDEKLTNITELPEWLRPAFAGTETLNNIQTKVPERERERGRERERERRERYIYICHGSAARVAHTPASRRNGQ